MKPQQDHQKRKFSVNHQILADYNAVAAIAHVNEMDQLEVAEQVLANAKMFFCIE